MQIMENRTSIISDYKYVTGVSPIGHLSLIDSYNGYFNRSSNYYRIELPCISMPYGLPQLCQHLYLSKE